MKRILFVDDEPALLSGLQRTLRPQRQRWEMTFVGSGQEALQRIAEQCPDMVISDMRMPHMDGAQFLQAVRLHYPYTLRMCLSGYSEDSSILNALPVTHACLSKPCDSQTLIQTVEKLLEAGGGLPLPVKQELISLNGLPCLPETGERLAHLLRQESFDPTAFTAAICQDVGASAKMLSIANSGFYGNRGTFRGIQEAVTMLGKQRLEGIYTSTEFFTPDPTVDLNWLQHFNRMAQQRLDSMNTGGSDRSFQKQTELLPTLREVGLLALKKLARPEQHADEALRFLVDLWSLPESVLHDQDHPLVAASQKPWPGEA